MLQFADASYSSKLFYGTVVPNFFSSPVIEEDMYTQIMFLFFYRFYGYFFLVFRVNKLMKMSGDFDEVIFREITKNWSKERVEKARKGK